MSGIWAGAAVLLGAAAGASGWPLLVVLPVVAALGWLGLRGSVPGRRQRTVVVAVLLGLAAVAGVRAATVAPVPDLTGLAGADRFEGRVVSPVQTDLHDQRFDLRLSRVRQDDEWRGATGTVRVTAPAATGLAYGDTVGLSGTFEPAGEGSSRDRSYLERQRLSGRFYARNAWVERPGHGVRRALFGFGAALTERLRRAVPGDSGVLLGGLVVGDDSALSPGAARAFRDTGMSHVTAVSGSNLALVVVLLMTVGQTLASRWRLAWLVVVVVAVWLYAWVTGLEPPVVRAALMATVALAARPFGRRPDYLTAAALSAAAMALVQPDIVFDIGFQLSLSASVALAALASGAVITTPAGAARLAVDGAIVAQLATLPITVAAFGTATPGSLLVNVLVGPLVAVAFPVAAAGALLGVASPPLGQAVMTCAGWVGDVILAVVEACARLPLTPLTLPPIPLVGRAALVLVSAVAVVLLSRDGRRWLGRAMRPAPAADELPKRDATALTAVPPDGIVPPGPHSLAAQDVTLSR